MANNTAEIKAVITADDRASRVLGQFGDGVGKVAHKAKIALEVAGVAVVAFGALSVKAFMDSENELAQLNAVLKATGGIAGVTADEATKLASSLQKVTRYSDEQILSGENLLLTFTNIGKDIFPRATEAMLDLSQTMKQDVGTSAIQLGKALQAPMLGMAALSRTGALNRDDMARLKASWEKNGTPVYKQQIELLEALEKQMKGSARAAGNTFAGQLDKIKNNLNDVQESLGKVIVRGLVPFTTKASEFIASIDWESVINKTTKAIGDFWDKLYELGRTIYDYLQPSLEALWDTFETKVLPTLQRLWKEVLEPLIPVIGTTLVVAIGLAIDALNLWWNIMTPIINWILDNKWVVIAFATTFTALAIAMNFDSIVASFGKNMATMITKILGVQTTYTIFTALLASPLTMPAIITAAAVASLWALYKTYQWISGEIEKGLDKLAKKEVKVGNTGITVKGNSDVGIISQIMQSFGFRAGGGPVNSGSPYIVGEKGPEMFVPKNSGTIIPNHKLGGDSGGQSININIAPSIGIYAGTNSERRQLALTILEDLKDVANQQNIDLNQLFGINPTARLA